MEFNAQPNPALARVYGVKNGVTISNVRAGTPAEQAGLQTGDTITSINGKPIKSGDELVNTISATKPGNKIYLSFVRNGQQKQASVTVAGPYQLFLTAMSRPKMPVTIHSQAPRSWDLRYVLSRRRWRNASVRPEGKGVVVTEVKPDSFADDIQMAQGDVILQINRQPVNSEEDFKKIMSKLGKSGEDVAFLVRRGRGAGAGNVFVSGTLP